jgi:hypothetical protein
MSFSLQPGAAPAFAVGELPAATDTCTTGDTSRIIHANDAFPLSPALHLRTGINTDNRLKEMIWVQTTLH